MVILEKLIIDKKNNLINNKQSRFNIRNKKTRWSIQGSCFRLQPSSNLNQF
jgi:hypothetical protein